MSLAARRHMNGIWRRAYKESLARERALLQEWNDLVYRGSFEEVRLWQRRMERAVMLRRISERGRNRI